MCVSKYNRLVYCLVLCLVLQCGVSSQATEFMLGTQYDDNIFIIDPSIETWSLLKQKALNGDVESMGQLLFVDTLDRGINDLTETVTKSHTLSEMGSTGAHTTLGFLLAHNLTGTHLQKEEQMQQAISHYWKAADQGNPVAQIIMATNSVKSNDCESALNYYRSASLKTLRTVREGDVISYRLVNYLRDEDSPFPVEILPSTDEIDLYEYLGSSGDGDTALKVAVNLWSGFMGLPADKERFMSFLRTSVARNNTRAMVILAQIYLREDTVGSDENGVDLLKLASTYKDPAAHAGLAIASMEGRGGQKKDLSTGLYHLEEGMKAGIIESFYLMGSYMEKYSLKPPTPFHNLTVTDFYSIASSFAHIHSMWHLAELYLEQMHQMEHNHILTSSEVSQQLCEKSMSLYRTVALSGNWRSLFHRAFEDFREGLPSAALLKYLLLSDMGYAAGHMNAARILETIETPLFSLEDSQKEALSMWQRAAELDIPTAHNKLGDYYFYGTQLAVNQTRAEKHYRTASYLGSPQAMFNCAWMQEWGIGVAQNISAARNTYWDLLNTYSEALVPSIFAIGRLEAITYLHILFHVNLHDVTMFDSQSYDVYFNLIHHYWDMLSVSLLLVVVLYLLQQRRLIA